MKTITEYYNKPYEQIVSGIKTLLLYFMPELYAHIIKHIKERIIKDKDSFAYIDLETNTLSINLDKIYESYVDFIKVNNLDDEKNKLLMFILIIYTREVVHFALKHYTRRKRFVKYLKSNNLPVNNSLIRWLTEFECNNVTEKIMESVINKADRNELRVWKSSNFIGNVFRYFNVPSNYYTDKDNDFDILDIITKAINDDPEGKKCYGNPNAISQDELPFEDIYMKLLEHFPDIVKKQQLKTSALEEIEYLKMASEITNDDDVYVDEIDLEEMVSLESLEIFLEKYDGLGNYTSNLISVIKKKTKKVTVPNFRSMSYILKDIGTKVYESWNKPSYKTNNFLNVYKGKERRAEQYPVGIVIDTSASVSENQLENVYSFIKEMFKVSNYLKLVYVDTQIKKVLEIKSPSDIEKEDINTFVGRGGTDLNPGIELLEKDNRIKHIMLLTDGFIDSITKSRKPIWMMLYNATGSTDSVAKQNNIPYYYITNE